MAPVIRGNSLYTIVDGPSWTQAEANSVKLGGNHITFNNNEELVWVQGYTKRRQMMGTNSLSK